MDRGYPPLGPDEAWPDAPVITSDLHVPQFCCEHAGPLRRLLGFHVLGLLRVRRPPYWHRIDVQPQTGAV